MSNFLAGMFVAAMALCLILTAVETAQLAEQRKSSFGYFLAVITILMFGVFSFYLGQGMQS